MRLQAFSCLCCICSIALAAGIIACNKTCGTCTLIHPDVHWNLLISFLFLLVEMIDPLVIELRSQFFGRGEDPGLTGHSIVR
jgi:hypothetical protein